MSDKVMPGDTVEITVGFSSLGLNVGDICTILTVDRNSSPHKLFLRGVSEGKGWVPVGCVKPAPKDPKQLSLLET